MSLPKFLTTAERRAMLDDALATHGYVCCICGLSIAPGTLLTHSLTPTIGTPPSR